jgi:23S rRNA (uracil747-C5)-methyltransferase
MHCDHYVAGRCRSCSQLEQSYPQQLQGKLAHCQTLLAEHAGHAGVEWLEPVMSPTTGFRNKAKMVVSGTLQAPLLGISDSRGRGTDLSDCPLYPAALQACFAPIASFITAAGLTPYDVAQRRGELKFVLVTLAEDSAELMVRFVLRSESSLPSLRQQLPSLLAALPGLRVVSVNLQPEHKAILEGEREIVLTEQQSLTMQLNGMSLHLRPKSFFQTNTSVAAALYRQAGAWVAEFNPTSIWDLFCGVGGFALQCADGVRQVTGIELSADAIASAEQSLRELGLQQVRFASLDATHFSRGGSAAPEMVIVNPPRRGIGTALCEFIEAASATRWLIYSSCNSETLVRDLQQLPSWRLRQARLLDMFPYTPHYEVITLLERVV